MITRTVPALLAGCLLFAACGGGSDDATETTTTVEAAATTPVVTEPVVTTAAPVTTTTVAMVVDGATVIVANGNIAGGSAGRMTDALGLEGFTTGPAVNGAEKVDESVVYYTAADGAQAVAESVAAKLGGVSAEAMPEPIPTEDGTLEGGDVLVLLGNNEADKSIAELSGVADPAAAVTNGGSTVVVANGSGIGGSAGRMTDQLEDAGFTVGEPTNSTAQATESVIYYGTDEAQADADILAATMGGLTVLPLPDDVPTDTGSLDGDILLVLGTNEADQSLAALGG